MLTLDREFVGRAITPVGVRALLEFDELNVLPYLHRRLPVDRDEGSSTMYSPL